MRAIICDRCGRQITDKEHIGNIVLETVNENGVTTGENEFGNYDLCPTCMEAIRVFVKGGMQPSFEFVGVGSPEALTVLTEDSPEPPPTSEKPKATIKKPISDGSKWAPVTPEKVEPIKTLAREGKTVKEIAEVTGVSDPTVRKYKREVDNEKNPPPVLTTE